MEPIIVPRPKGVRDPNRPAGSLLLAQVKHLREAEKSLPPEYHSRIFSHAIQTEGEAARYVRTVTEAIHRAHDHAAAERVKRVAEREGVISIAAAGAEEAAEPKRRSGSKGKKKGGRSARKE
jgi:hypothetical protein